MRGEEIPTLPRKIQHVISRPLEIEELEIIFQNAGGWWLYYALLLATGPKCVDVAMLTHWSIDHERGAIRLPEGRTGRFSEFRLGLNVMEQIPKHRLPSEPLFPTLYVSFEDESFFEEQMDENLAVPLDYLQGLLGAAGRPLATLFSFRLTHRNLLQNRDPSYPD